MKETRIPKLLQPNVRLRVRQLAEEKEITLAELSYGAQITRQQLYHIWNGQSKAIGLETLGKIAYALNVDIGELFEVSNEDRDLESESSEGNKNPVLIRPSKDNQHGELNNGELNNSPHRLAA